MKNPNPAALPGPGRDTDQLVYEKLGWHYEPRFEGDVEGYMVKDNKRVIFEEWEAWANSLDSALELIHKLAEDDIKVDIGSTLQNTFEVSAWKWDNAKLDEIELYNIIHENPAYAVCMAFLAVYRG